MNNRQVPDREQILSIQKDRSNWGRWGDDDQLGAMNLVTPEKRAAAAGLVRTGRTVSLSRPFPTQPGPGNPKPAQHQVHFYDRPQGGGAAVDYYGISYHGLACTHIDALCHAWDDDGMWGGRSPKEHLASDGAKWGGIDNWSDGIVTRGVLLDVARHRGEPHIAAGRPVHDWELAEGAEAQGVEVGPGDALVVHGGRAALERSDPLWPPPPWLDPDPVRPGLHASCLSFIRDRDVSLLVWDLMDEHPTGYDLAWTVHAALFRYGVGLVDDAHLEDLAAACAEEGRFEFLLVVAPLRVVGGTGSPVNPIAIF